MATGSRGVEKSAPLFAFVVTIFLVSSLLSYLCHFFRSSGAVVDYCHFLKVTLVSYPPTFLVCFLPPIHSPLFLFKTFTFCHQHLCIVLVAMQF